MSRDQKDQKYYVYRVRSYYEPLDLKDRHIREYLRITEYYDDEWIEHATHGNRFSKGEAFAIMAAFDAKTEDDMSYGMVSA